MTVTLTVTDSRCAATYFVEVTQDGSSDSPVIMSSSSPSVSVTDLDLCRNSYSIVGFVQAPSSQRGARSLSQPIPVDSSGTRANYIILKGIGMAKKSTNKNHSNNNLKFMP